MLDKIKKQDIINVSSIRRIKMKKIAISPSVMCADLVNLESSIRELEAIGVDSLHIDLIDGLFSPSMPLGIDTVKKLRKITDMEFDVHIMSMNNELFINEMLDIGAESITFHYESSFHTDRLINLVKRSGAKVGIALNPATSLSVLDYILPQCDTVLLMLINPGFATDKREKQVNYAGKKVKDLYELIKKNNLDVKIQVDGRVSLDTIPGLVSAGADSLVVGSTSLFIPGKTITENKKLLDVSISEGLKGGNF
jgi:ribulose-phosphate 3-epimerase